MEGYTPQVPQWIETTAMRENRLLDGKAHTTAWPIKVSKPDDGLTIPEPMLKRNRAHNWNLIAKSGMIVRAL
jgi:hypothetical protein